LLVMYSYPMIKNREIPDEEMTLMQAVDKAIERAGEKMELADLPEDMDDDEKDSVYEERFHCGKCIVTAVMETIWDDLSALMDYYEQSGTVQKKKSFAGKAFSRLQFRSK